MPIPLYLSQQYFDGSPLKWYSFTQSNKHNLNALYLIGSMTIYVVTSSWRIFTVQKTAENVKALNAKFNHLTGTYEASMTDDELASFLAPYFI